jgi:DNA polymerase III epsilon subunit-like protein
MSTQLETELDVDLGDEPTTAPSAGDHFVIIDTETSGLPNFKLPADDPAQPRLASMAMIFVNAKLEVEREDSAFIRPDGWVLEPGAAAVNGLTMERLLAEGVPVREALTPYASAILQGRVVVAHNAQFDCKVLRGEFRRLGLPDLFEQTRNICTMRALTDVCRIPPNGNRGGFKFPKLSEACVFFNMPLLGDHSSLNDARACLQLFRKMHELGVVPEAKIHLAKERAA